MIKLKRWKVVGAVLVAIIVLSAVVAATPIGNPSPPEAEACGFYREPPDGGCPTPWWQWWWGWFD